MNLQIPISLFDGILLSALTSALSFVGSYTAIKVTMKYMQRDILRAQDTADSAHVRIDGVLGWPAGKRHGDNQLGRKP